MRITKKTILGGVVFVIILIITTLFEIGTMIQPDIQILDFEAREVAEDQWSTVICYISIQASLRNDGADGWAEVLYETKWGPATLYGATYEGSDSESEWVFLERGETKNVTSSGLEACLIIDTQYGVTIVSEKPKEEFPLSQQDPDIEMAEIQMLQVAPDPRLPPDPRVGFKVTLRNHGGDGEVELRFETIWDGRVQDSKTCTYAIAYDETKIEWDYGSHLRANPAGFEEDTKSL